MEQAVQLTRSHDPSDSTKYFVPASLDEAIAELDAMLPVTFKERFRSSEEDDLILYHHSLGTWIRNEWQLWAGGALARHFSEHGIIHPDAMSGIILDSYWCHLNGKARKPPSQVGRYQSYWRSVAGDRQR